MEGVTRETAINLDDENEGRKEAVNGQLSEEISVGGLLWVKLHESSWWPGQVVDENTVSDRNKPSSKTSTNDVLVRLYGSYKYMYVDVHKSLAEFKKILIENNLSHSDIMKNTLEQDISRLNSGRSRRQPKPKGTVESGASLTGLSEKDASSQKTVSRKKRKQETQSADKSHPETPKVKVKSKSQKLDGVHNNGESSTPNNGTMRREEVSARRTKIMQSLGLIAPLGSPFPRDGLISPTSAIRR